MLAWIRSTRGSTMTATVVAVVLALFWLAPWQKPLSVKLPFADPAAPPAVAPALPASPEPSPPVAQAPAAPPTTASNSPSPAVTPPTVAPQAVAPPGPVVANAEPPPAAASVAPAGVAAPSFDIVRVEPTGESVIAGRGEPGSEVLLLDGETVIAHGLADASGQFALLPDSLAEGSHYLTLKTQKPGQPAVKSEQGVAVSMLKGAATKPMVALLSPDHAAQVLSDGSAPVTPPPKTPGQTVPATPTPVAIQSVEAGQGGKFMAAGTAHPGSQCRVYLNGAYLADVTAGKDGRWSVEIKKGMKPGRYTVRADEIGASGGAVVHRAEVPFDYPVAMAGQAPGSAKRLLMARAAVNQPAPVAAPVPPSVVPTAALQSHPASSQLKPPTAGVAATMPQNSPPTARSPSDEVASSDPGTHVASAPAAPPPAAAVIASLNTTTVLRGDSLWRISRKMLGHGIQYTEIYASNVGQIRDPALIYPGQIFVVPNKTVN